MRTHKSVLLRSVLLATGASMGALVGCDQSEPTQDSKASGPRPIKTYLVSSPGQIRSNTFTGTVKANDSAQLAFLVGGRLIEFPVDDGQELSEGDIIGRLDSRDFQYQVDAAQSLVNAAESRLTRLRRALEKNAVSEMEVIEQEANYQSALARLRIAEKALADTVLQAPFDGVVAATLVNQYEDIGAAQGVVLFQSKDIIEIEVAIPEQDLVHASEANPGTFVAKFHSLPGREFELSLKEVATQADAVTQTYKVGLTMPSPKGVLILPGMTAEVTWSRPTEPTLASSIKIPVGSTFSLPNGDTQVWVIDPVSMAVGKRRITLGPLADHGMVEIVDGLQPGDLIAAAGTHHLSDGLVVRSSSGNDAISTNGDTP